jgi:hypothetical protein
MSLLYASFAYVQTWSNDWLSPTTGWDADIHSPIQSNAKHTKDSDRTFNLQGPKGVNFVPRYRSLVWPFDDMIKWGLGMLLTITTYPLPSIFSVASPGIPRPGLPRLVEIFLY